MTEKTDFSGLTYEEQTEIAATVPNLLKALKEGSPVAIPWLKSWRSRKAVGEVAEEQAAEIQQEVLPATNEPEQGHLAQWCGFPTDMTRCSPFFPINQKFLGERTFLRDFLITAANWGEIRYTGPQLSIYEEDALMALLAVLDGVSQHRQVAETDDGRKTYTYTGPALPLLRLLGYDRPSKKDYARLISSLKLLMSAVVELSIAAGKTKRGRKREPKAIYLANMLSGVKWDVEEKVLSATVNPFFYETYAAGRVTLLDVVKRISLKGSVAKALYRFVQSQRASAVFEGHFLTLADALNMDREQPGKEVRRALKTAISELVRQGVLVKKSGFVSQDIIRLNRAPEALPTRKKREAEKP